MKSSIKLLTAAAIAVAATVLSPQPSALGQTLSISGTNAGQGSLHGNVGGSLTLTNAFNGYTNTGSVVVFYGAFDAGTLTGGGINQWQYFTSGGSGFTNGASWSASITNVTPGAIVFWRARANDGTGYSWATDGASFTSTATSYNQGSSSNNWLILNPGNKTSTVSVVNGHIVNIQ